MTEYASAGDLLHYVKWKKRLDEEKAKFIFKEILYGLAHCHCWSVMHWDIKLDNILLDSENGIKICDFGVSKIIGKYQKINEQCGTPAYIAPEIISNKGYEAYYPDFWSAGVLLYTMLIGTVPFKAGSMSELHQLINKANFKFSERV